MGILLFPSKAEAALGCTNDSTPDGCTLQVCYESPPAAGYSLSGYARKAECPAGSSADVYLEFGLSSSALKGELRPCTINGQSKQCTTNYKFNYTCSYAKKAYGWESAAEMTCNSSGCSTGALLGSGNPITGNVQFSTPREGSPEWQFTCWDNSSSGSWMSSSWLFDTDDNVYTVSCIDNSDCSSGQICNKSGNWDSWQCKTPPPPSVTTNPAINITSSFATLQGSANPNGLADSKGWFRYSTTNPGSCNDTFGEKVPSQGQSLSPEITPVLFAAFTNRLTPETTYYFCAIAQNSSGISFGEVLNFKTLPPLVTTIVTTDITNTTAILNGSVIPLDSLGRPIDVTAGFRYGLVDIGRCSETFGTSTGGVFIPKGTNPVPFSKSISSLQPGITYYACATAHGNNGNLIGFGDLLPFTTTGSPPPGGQPTDTQPPTTSYSIDSNLSITLTCNDDLAGCQKVLFCIDTNNTCNPNITSFRNYAYTNGANQLSILGVNGAYIRYFSIDNLNKNETVKSNFFGSTDPVGPLPSSTSDLRVFVTSTVYGGALGGLIGADIKCQERANAANLGGTWKAWLSDFHTSASEHITHTTGKYKLLDGTIIANGWADLTDGTLLQAINKTESGSTPKTNVWTGTRPDGLGSINLPTCDGWSVSNTSATGSVGSAFSTDGKWTAWGTRSCAVSFTGQGGQHLYCFEQPSCEESNITLALNPATATVGTLVTPSAILTSCSGKIITFKKGPCTTGEECSNLTPTTLTCTSTSGGCTANAFTAPLTAGSYQYSALIDKNGDGDTLDAGERGTATLNVTASVTGGAGGGGSAQTSSSACSVSQDPSLTRVLDGLISTSQPITGRLDSNTGKCVVDPKAAFFPFKIPSFDDLKSIYFDQK